MSFRSNSRGVMGDFARIHIKMLGRMKVSSQVNFKNEIILRGLQVIR